MRNIKILKQNDKERYNLARQPIQQHEYMRNIKILKQNDKERYNLARQPTQRHEYC